MIQLRPDALILTLMGIVILLMLAIVGLFVRMNQLQSAILQSLERPQAMERPSGLDVGTEAPVFTLVDTEGNRLSLEDFSGRRVLLAFGNVDCPACQLLYPDLAAFAEQGPGVQLMMISRGSLKENQQLVEEHSFGFPILMWEDLVVREYEVPGTPFFYLIDADGVIINKGVASTSAQLNDLVATQEE